MITQNTLGNILSYPILILQILFLRPDYRGESFDSVQYIQVHPNYTREYSVLPHIKTANISPWPSVFPRLFLLSPDYQRQYCVFAHYILFSPRYTREYSV